jgi:hypothetical protein
MINRSCPPSDAQWAYLEGIRNFITKKIDYLKT